MRLALVSLLALAPLTASAGGMDAVLDGVGSVTISSTVEVDLLRGAATGYLPAVEAKAPSAGEGAPENAPSGQESASAYGLRCPTGRSIARSQVSPASTQLARITPAWHTASTSALS